MSVSEVGFIRQYERQISVAAVTIEERIKAEKQWLSLHRGMKKAKRQLSKKRQVKLQPFIQKTLHLAMSIGQEVFNELVPSPLTGFMELEKRYCWDYVADGVKALIAHHHRLHQIHESIDERIEEFKREETLKSMPNEEWAEAVRSLSSIKPEGLADTFELEEKLTDLVLVYEWTIATNKSLKKQFESVWYSLINKIERIQDQLLRLMNYSLTIQDVAINRHYRNCLRREGLLQTIQYLEDNDEEGFVSPVVREAMEHVNIQHPLHEFPEATKMKRHFVIHAGPTNSGKTYHAIEALRAAKSGAYLAPIRLLALEIQEKLCEEGVPCDLATGEGKVFIPGATHRSSTIEMAALRHKVDVAVIDEMQMVDDPFRGFAWIRAIFGMQAHEIHLCGAAHAVPFMIQLIEESGDTFEVREYERKTPLIVEEQPFSFPHSVQKGDALIVFSKAKVIRTADELRRAGYKVSMIYGKLPAETRRQQVELFHRGETDVVVATDAIGIGLNLPIRRTVFLETKKFDGSELRSLTTQEVKQISGRAGRQGKYEQGYVTSLGEREWIADELDKVEPIITRSVISPSPALTDVEVGTLRQRLRAWQEVPFEVPYLEKADISGQLTLLKRIERWEQDLSSSVLFKTLYIPFDVKDRELLSLWTDYVRQMKEGNPSLTRPKRQGGSLIRMENFYQQLNLYDQFSRKFHMKVDFHWIRTQKEKTIHHINRAIRSNAQ